MKVIQVGIGGMGNRWLETVLASDEVHYAGFVEINPDIAAMQIEKHGLDTGLIFSSLPEALDKVQADAVIDVTPPQFHREVSLTALDAGLPVLSEKPLAGTLPDALEIVQKADETGILHMVAQNYRYSVAAQTLKQALADMGHIASVTVEFFKGPHFGGFREEMPYPLIIDMAIHHIDLMRHLLESDPVSVFGRSWNPPWSWFNGDASASVSMEFANGVVASYNGSWCAPGRETSWNGNWRFDCEDGVVEMIDDRVIVHPWLDVDGFNNVYIDPLIIEPLEMPRIAQAYLLHEFYQAVTEGTSPATTCQDNIKSLQTIFNIVESFETGHIIRKDT
jgi:predicted dehydrogenase